MKTIFKYPIPVKDTFTLSLPIGAVILCVQIDKKDGKPYIWAKVDTEMDHENRDFAIEGTGNLIHFNNGVYIETFQQDGFVWHLFEITKESEVLP